MTEPAPPTEADLNVHDSLDERVATEHFLGRTVEDAERMFRDDGALYQEDLMWMGPRAFAYYLPAAVRYLTSPDAAGDAFLVSSLHEVIRFRLREGDLGPAHETVLDLVDHVLADYDKFEVNEEAYGDLLGDYEELKRQLEGTP